MRKLIYLDLETTGLVPDEHGVIQISGEIEIDGETKEIFKKIEEAENGDR